MVAVLALLVSCTAEQPNNTDPPQEEKRPEFAVTIEDALEAREGMEDTSLLHVEPFHKGALVFSRQVVKEPGGEREELVFTTIQGNVDIGWSTEYVQPHFLRCEKAALCSDADSAILVADPNKWPEDVIPRIIYGVINDESITKAEIHVQYSGEVIPVTIVDTPWKSVFYAVTEEQEIDEMTVTGYDKDGKPVAEAVW